MGFRYRLHRKDLPGKPDIVFVSRRKVIFVHGCFWHQHQDCRDGRMPRSNLGYWEPKLARNVQRDAQTSNALRTAGWDVLIVWECETGNVSALTQRLKGFLESTMPKRDETKNTSDAQYERFKEAALELECDDDEGRFRDRFKKLTEAPAPETVEPKKVAAAKPRKKPKT
jgi:DNA mismatch endonuclease (patch repair protein)